jgi:hypothetical protein
LNGVFHLLLDKVSRCFKSGLPLPQRDLSLFLESHS